MFPTIKGHVASTDADGDAVDAAAVGRVVPDEHIVVNRVQGDAVENTRTISVYQFVVLTAATGYTWSS